MKKTIAVLMIFLLCLSLLLPAAQGADAEPDYMSKLSADLIKYMEGKADDARIRVQIELDAPNLRDLDAKPAEMPATVEAWAASKEARYQQYLRECSAIYDPFVQTYLNDPEDLVYLQPDYCFVLSTIPKSRIVALAKLPEVRSICRGYGYEPYTPKDGEEIDPAVLAKLDIFLLGQMQTSPDDAMIPISIDLAAPSAEEIEATVTMPVSGSGSTLEELNAYESAKREAKREVFSAITTAFVENYLDENDNVRFRGNYIPTVTVEVPKPKVFLLAALEEVTQITWAGSDAPAYPTGTEASDSPEAPDYTAKLSYYLIKNMEAAADDARLPIAVQLVSPSPEEIEAMIPIPQPDVHPPVTVEEVNTYLAAKRKVELEVYSAITDAFVQEHLDENDTVRYQGKYLPLVKCTVPKSKILSLAALEEVSAIDYISMSLVQPVIRDEEAAKAKMTDRMKAYMETAADDEPVPIRVDLHMPSEEIMERIVSVPKPSEDASQEEIDAYNAAYQETWRYQVSLRTDTFVNSTLMDTEQVYYIGEDDATVICEVSGGRVMNLAYTQEITHIDLAGVAVPTGNNQNIDFTFPADAEKFTVDNQTDSSIIEGEGFYMISTNEAIEDCKGQLSGDAANTPRDLVKVPVSGDWTATLYLKADTSGSNGQYEFLCLYGMADYDNGCGIRAGNGSTVNFKEVNGVNESSTDGMKVQTGLTSGTDHWYRLKKEGTTYTGFLSEDGENFQKVFTYEDTDIEAKMIVIDAYSGRSTGYQYWLQSLTFEDDIPFMYPTYYLEVAVRTAAKIDKSKYTEESVKVLEDAVAAAESVIAKTTVDDFDQDEINNAEQAIYDAIDALVEKTDEMRVDKSALNVAIAEAEGIVAVYEYDYSVESLGALRDALGAARAVLADENATQEAVDAAVSALKEAKAALAPIVHIPEPNTFTLDMAIAEAEAIDRSKYTDESLADLDQALNHAKWAKANYADYSQQKEVDAAAKNLEDAIAALVEKPAEPFRFDDVKNSGKFYYEPVYWAFNHEPQITKGVDDTHFGPDQGCTRGQVVTFLWRAAGCQEPTKTENPFGDVKKSAFYYKAVLWAVENGVTKGTSETTFTPDATCTRGQIVTFLYRAKGSPELTKKENPFKDVADGQFYAEAVAWAVENNVTKGKSADTFAPNATCTRGEVVTFLYRAMLLPEPVEPEPALTDINAMLLRGPSKGGNDTLPKQTVSISSTKELQDYLESVYEMELFEAIAPDKYTDAYFVNNVLLLTPVKVCGSGPGFTITSVTEKEDQIEVELAKPGGPETPDMCAWVLLIEAAKSMPEREVVIDINQPLGPDCFYGFEAQSVDELIAWINGDVDEDSEAYWQREYFEDYMDAVEKKKRIPVVESAAQTYTRWSINVSSDTNILEYSFQNNDPEQGGLYIDFLMPDKPLEVLIEEEGAFLREYFSDWELTESTVKVGGVDTQIFSWGGVENTIRESCKKVFEAPTAWFEYDGFVVHMYGDYRMSQTKWDDAWLEQFVFSIVELT